MAAEYRKRCWRYRSTEHRGNRGFCRKDISHAKVVNSRYHFWRCNINVFPYRIHAPFKHKIVGMCCSWNLITYEVSRHVRWTWQANTNLNSLLKNSIRTDLGVDVDLLWNTIRYLKNGEYSGPCKDRASNGLSQRRLRISDYSNSSRYSINNDFIDTDDEC